MTERRKEDSDDETVLYRVLRRIAIIAAYATLFGYALMLGLSGRF